MPFQSIRGDSDEYGSKGARDGRHAGGTRLAAAGPGRSARAVEQVPRLASRSRFFPSARGRFPRPVSWLPAPDGSSSNAITGPCAIEEGLLEEHRFLAHLLAHGAPVPRVFAAAFGETAIEMGEWTYEVHDAPGRRPLRRRAISWTPFRTAAHAHSAGQALARLHLAAQGFDSAAPQASPACGQLHDLCRARSERGDGALSGCASGAHGLSPDTQLRYQALELLAPFHAELLPLLPALEPLWTHNDLHASNLILERRRRRCAGRGDHRLRTRRPHQRRTRSGARHRAQHRGVACARERSGTP